MLYKLIILAIILSLNVHFNSAEEDQGEVTADDGIQETPEGQDVADIDDEENDEVNEGVEGGTDDDGDEVDTDSNSGSDSDGDGNSDSSAEEGEAGSQSMDESDTDGRGSQDGPPNDDDSGSDSDGDGDSDSSAMDGNDSNSGDSETSRDDTSSDDEDDDECNTITNVEDCGAVTTDECGFDVETDECYSVERRRSGTFDDGYNAAQQQAADDAKQSEVLLGVLCGIIGILVLMVGFGGYWIYKQHIKKTEDVQKGINVEIEDVENQNNQLITAE